MSLFRPFVRDLSRGLVRGVVGGGGAGPSFAEAVASTNPQAHFRLGSENIGQANCIDATGQFNAAIWNRGSGTPVIHTAPGFVGDGSTSTRFSASGFVDFATQNGLANGLFCAPDRQWSMSAFVRCPASPNQMTILARASGTAANRTFSLYTGSGATPGIVLRGTTSAYPLGINDNQDHMISVTWDGSVARLYLDGYLARIATVGSASEEEGQRITLGQRTNGTGYASTGDLGEVIFWDRVVSSAEISEIYKASGKTRHITGIIGSSTDAGTGASPGNSWAELYADWYSGVTHNIAVGSSIISRGTPIGTIIPAGWTQEPDINRNVTNVIMKGASRVLVGYASNEVFQPGISPESYLSMAAAIKAACDETGVEFFIRSTQPRSGGTNSAQRLILRQIAEALRDSYGSKCIYVFDDLANPDNTLKSEYDSGDGIHLNDAGHLYLFNRYKTL